MTVPQQSPRNVSTAAAGATVFPYDFKILAETDLQVQVDGVTKTIGVHYDVSGVGAESGGQIVFKAAMSGGETVMRRRLMPFARSNDFLYLDDLRSSTLNNDQDAPIMMLQQIGDEVDRSLKLPPSSTGSGDIVPLTPLAPLIVSADGQGVESGSTQLTGDMLLRPNLADSASGKGAALVAFKQSGTGAIARSMAERASDTLSIKDFAKGDGTTDDTAAVQAAANEAISSGRELIVPAGTYRLTAPILVGGRFAMRGCGFDPETQKGACFFLAHTGRGFDFTPSSGTQTIGNAICGIGTRRTQPTPAASWAPNNHDWDFYAYQSGGGDFLFEDVVLLNATQGITATGRVMFRNVRGQAFKTFISTPFNADTTRFIDCHQWPFWSASSGVKTYMLANLTAFRLARVDNPLMAGCFSIWHNVGVAIYNDGVGTVSKLRVVNSDMDAGNTGIRVFTGANGVTMSISNFVTQGESGVTTSWGLCIDASSCAVEMDNTTISDYSAQCIYIGGSGNYVRLGHHTLRNYNLAAIGYPGIEAASGNTVELTCRPRISGGGSGAYFGGAGTIIAPLGTGQVTTTTDAAGGVVVNHGLGVAPNNIQLTLRAPDVAYILRVDSVSSTQFVVRVRNNSGALVASGSVQFFWRADY
ncbi:glycosyl hydrolase family 28-related protein [Xanthomonas albilineans]|uniref:glycosyl hydrolase family 28-related protein n=1 Tax=Xanthomonas albilineans TaxID=29447 RepID=UPI0005F3381A|nr:glycosyl hydrolase family 28-related protein [Xanthomonas albilineans]